MNDDFYQQIIDGIYIMFKIYIGYYGLLFEEDEDD